MWQTETEIENLLGESWFFQLRNQFKAPYMKRLSTFLSEQRKKTKFFPPDDGHLFQLIKMVPFEEVVVVFVGLDPILHGVSKTINSFMAELSDDINDGLKTDKQFDFVRLSKQGILFLDTAQTYDEKDKELHANRGWEDFTKYVVHRLNSHPNNLVFVLLGEDNHHYKALIDDGFHKVIEIPHPIDKEWSGSKPFSKISLEVAKNYVDHKIDW